MGHASVSLLEVCVCVCLFLFLVNLGFWFLGIFFVLSLCCAKSFWKDFGTFLIEAVFAVFSVRHVVVGQISLENKLG